MAKQVASLAPTKVVTLDATGAVQGPATKGLNVYLAEPPQDGRTFDWKTFVIGDAGELDTPQGAAVPLAPTLNWWCLWSTQPIAPADLTNDFTPKKGAFDKTQGFPLPTQIKDGKLCLPENRKLTVAVFDISGVSDPVDPNDAKGRTQTQQFLDATQSYYDQLLITLDFQRQQRPQSVTDNWLLFRAFDRGQMRHPELFDKDPKNYHENTLEKDVNGQVVNNDPQPDLSTALPITSDAKKTITILFVSRFINFGNTLGVAWPTTPITKVRVKQFELFTVPKNGFVILARQVSAAATNAVAHELGHCLLHDPGLGTSFAEAVGGKPAVSAFLSKMKLRLKYDDLFQDRHAPGASNLMFKFGGQLLVPWQVATIRAAHELVPDPGLMAAP